MKAITLRQPFATLVALGEQWLVTRQMPTDHRGPLGIYATPEYTRADAEFTVTQPEIANTLVRHAFKGPGELPLGAMVAIVQLVDVVPVERIDRAWITPPFVSGPGRYVISEKDQAYADFSPGRYAWIFNGVEKLPQPVRIAAPEGDGLWEWAV